METKKLKSTEVLAGYHVVTRPANGNNDALQGKPYCGDVNECLESVNPCSADGSNAPQNVCTNRVGGYYCSCGAQYEKIYINGNELRPTCVPRDMCEAVERACGESRVSTPFGYSYQKVAKKSTSSWDWYDQLGSLSARIHKHNNKPYESNNYNNNKNPQQHSSSSEDDYEKNLRRWEMFVTATIATPTR